MALGAALENFREIYKTVRSFVLPETIQWEREAAMEDKQLEIVITEAIINLLRAKLN